MLWVSRVQHFCGGIFSGGNGTGMNKFSNCAVNKLGNVCANQRILIIPWFLELRRFRAGIAKH